MKNSAQKTLDEQLQSLAKQIWQNIVDKKSQIEPPLTFSLVGIGLDDDNCFGKNSFQLHGMNNADPNILAECLNRAIDLVGERGYPISDLQWYELMEVACR